VNEAFTSALHPLTGKKHHLPIVLQTEAAECGLACMAMVAQYHGHRFSLNDLRRQLPISSKGVTLASVLNMAQALQLEGRAVKLDLNGLAQLRLPCVLHWDMNHFVVLKRMGRQHLVLHDPAVGERRLTLDEVGKHFSGVALELSPATDFKPVDVRQPLRLSALIGRVMGLRRGVAQILGLALALELLAMAMPFQLQWVIDQALLAADRDLMAALSVGFLLLVLLQAGIGALRGWLIATLATHLNFQWLGHVFGHLLKLPMAYFEKRHLGAIQSYFGSVTHIQRTLTTGFTQAVVDGVLVIGTFIMMLVYAPKLAALALLAVVIYAVVHAVLFRRLRLATAEQIVCNARQHTHFLETVRGIQGVRLFGRESERRMGWMNLLADEFNAHLRAEKTTVAQRTAHVLLFGVEGVVVIWLAALAVLRTELTLGMFFAFLAYKTQFSLRMAALVDKLFELSMLRLHAERLADIVLAEPERDDVPTELNLERIDAQIELRDVSFRYSPTEAEVLRHVNLTIAAGECVAITGASGCGKTTLAKIMLGLLEPTSGEVLLGGHPLRRLGLKNYRAIVGTVMQDDTLYTGSIADNIAFFAPQPDEARIEKSAHMAAVHDEIMRMPMGYQTLVGDIGTGLSGGQKQRIYLARALYRQPRILVLDEATSHLDVTNEQHINHTVRALNLTRIVIAHRPDTIAMADRVIEL
jgi:ATP-binding cassette, subfamily B, bacterial CvaB/MchF/RaxB